jgi:hypothetical protein
VDGVRAERILARVRQRESADSAAASPGEVVILAEGNVRKTGPDDSPTPRLTARWLTNEGVEVQAYQGGRLERLQARPQLERAWESAMLALRPASEKTTRNEQNTAVSESQTTIAASANTAPPPLHPPVLPSKGPADSEVAKGEPLHDSMVRPAQLGEDVPDLAAPAGPIVEDDALQVPTDLPPAVLDPLEAPLQGDVDSLPLPLPPPAPGEVIVPGGPGGASPAPLIPGSKRSWGINLGPGATIETLENEQGEITLILRGGVNIVGELPGNVGVKGTVDLSADSMIVWTRRDAAGGSLRNAAGGRVVQDQRIPLEVYLEGNVVVRQDQRKYAGTSDQVTFKAEKAYFDFRTERFIALDAEIDFYAPGLIAPIRSRAARIDQYRPMVRLGNALTLGSPRIQTDRTVTSGSRFPRPGYRFESATLDLERVEEDLTDPATGAPVGDPRDPNRPKDAPWIIDSRQNVFYMGSLPVFFWPRIRTRSDDLDPPLRQIAFRGDRVFGQQVLSDWSGFKLIGQRRPAWIDNWNIDIDYLSYRGFALGSELGWFGRDLIADLSDPYRTRRSDRGVDRPYWGYLDLWGIKDYGTDILGSGPAVVTNPPYRDPQGLFWQRGAVPPAETLRGRFLYRHMQSLLPDEHEADEDLRFQFESSYSSDRHFMEQYYKRLWDMGLDQANLGYFIWQRQNSALTLLGEVNLQPWYTDTQWLPRLGYTRLGDSFLADRLTYSTDSGIAYANQHPAVEVANLNTFAFLPYDPVSNTSYVFRTARAWTTHEIDAPFNLGFMRVVPYVQGQLVGYSNQIDYDSVGRAWGAYGARVNMMAWRTFMGAENEILNVHGLAHKVNFNLDYRAAYSSYPVSQLGILDDYDDNTYEFVRRYFAMNNYVGGLLPPQYDPRLYAIRTTLSPLTGSVDLQNSMETFTFNLSQRLQTQRGPEGRRRVTDWMVLDLNTTFFPRADRDNFGEPLGLTTYNYEWFIGDRTSFLSSGWFEFWDIQGTPILIANPRQANDPFGLKVITAGVSLNRPPRGNVYLGYSIVNTGPIATSALNVNYNYWLSPKWYTTFGMSYDFGNAILLGTTFSLTKIGKDYLTSVGLTVDPQRNNYTFGFEIAPRFSPNVRLGSAVGPRFDSRFAPTQ